MTKAATHAARWDAAALRAREQPEEVSSFGTTATTDFKTEDNTISMHRDRNALHVTCSVAPLALKPLSPCALPATLWQPGFEPPIWEELLQAEAPSQPEEDPSLDLTRGWQRPRPKPLMISATVPS